MFASVFKRMMASAKTVASIVPAPIASTSMTVRWGSSFRDTIGWKSAWPNYQKHLTHRKHYIPPHTYDSLLTQTADTSRYAIVCIQRRRERALTPFLPTSGVQRQTRLRVVDNSKIGREAMARGKPPKVIGVYSDYRSKRPHHAWGKLGDRVKVAILGLKKEGIIVGLKVKQVHGVPRFDSNNIVLIDSSGSPLGTRIHVPIPQCIREVLKQKSIGKKHADYTKIMAIATKFV